MFCSHPIFIFTKGHQNVEGENKGQITQWSFLAVFSTYLLQHDNFQGFHSRPYSWPVCGKSGWHFAEDCKEKDTKDFLWLPFLA